MDSIILLPGTRNVPPVGIEPTTTRLGLVRSTTELRRLVPTPGIEPGTRSYTRSRDA